LRRLRLWQKASVWPPASTPRYQNFYTILIEHVLDRGAQSVACGDVAMSQQEKITRQMRKRREKILAVSSAQRQGAPRGDVLSKSWKVGRSLAAQATQAHVEVVGTWQKLVCKRRCKILRFTISTASYTKSETGSEMLGYDFKDRVWY
jgi:hypothetical protein